MNRSILLIIIILFSSSLIWAQPRLSTNSKKAAELYYEADNFRVRGQYLQAIDFLEQAIAKDKKFHEAYFRLGVIYKAKGDLPKAEQLLLKVIELNAGNNAASFFELSELYLKRDNYKESINYIDKYLDYNPRNRERVEEAVRIKANAQYALENISTAAEFNPHPLSDTVNAFAMQYFPVLSVDQQSIIYTRRLGTSSQYDEDLVISTKNENGSWGTPRSISENINSEYNEGTCTLSADGRILIFTSCVGRPGYGSCDLFISTRKGDEWSVPENMGPEVNSFAWDSQPSLSADGRRLFFISNRGGGIGGRDIWVTSKNEKNKWTKPVNLGRAVNTAKDEVSPFIHPNGITLYYATNGLPGFGGFDIYYTDQKMNNWSQPKNLGAPINNGQDQVSLFITADGEKGYYSNEDNRSKERKGSIYEFTVPQAQRIQYKTSYVFGTVRDEPTLTPLSAKIELIDLDTDTRVSLIESDSISGEYLFVLPEGSEYALYIEKENYLFQSSTFIYNKGEDADPIRKDILLTPIEVGAVTKLNNIFFETDKYELVEKSKTELKKIIYFLKSNPHLVIQINGHTDNVGNDKYNLVLSENRAKSVYDYLVKNGLNVGRLKYIGFGSSNPSATNETADGRQLNRRIEFKIVRLE